MSEEPRKEIAKIIVGAYGFGEDALLEAQLVNAKDGVIDKIHAIVEREKKELKDALLRLLKNDNCSDTVNKACCLLNHPEDPDSGGYTEDVQKRCFCGEKPYQWKSK